MFPDRGLRELPRLFRRGARRARSGASCRAQGYDTFIGPSIAYSTLGHLRDPVLNTMLAYGDTELAAFIFHELAHQAVYAPGRQRLQRGVRDAWSRTRGSGAGSRTRARPAELEKFVALRARARPRPPRLMVAARATLAALYAKPLEPRGDARGRRPPSSRGCARHWRPAGLRRPATTTTRDSSPSPRMSAACRPCGRARPPRQRPAGFLRGDAGPRRPSRRRARSSVPDTEAVAAASCGLSRELDQVFRQRPRRSGCGRIPRRARPFTLHTLSTVSER